MTTVGGRTATTHANPGQQDGPLPVHRRTKRPQPQPHTGNCYGPPTVGTLKKTPAPYQRPAVSHRRRRRSPAARQAARAYGRTGVTRNRHCAGHSLDVGHHVVAKSGKGGSDDSNPVQRPVRETTEADRDQARCTETRSGACTHAHLGGGTGQKTHEERAPADQVDAPRRAAQYRRSTDSRQQEPTVASQSPPLPSAARGGASGSVNENGSGSGGGSGADGSSNRNKESIRGGSPHVALPPTGATATTRGTYHHN